MDTKLKSLSKNPFIRGLLIVLCAALLTASAFAFVAVVLVQDEMEISLEDLMGASQYTESRALSRDFRQKAEMAIDLFSEYKSEAHIKSGGTLTDWVIEEAQQELFYEYYNEGILFGGQRENGDVRAYTSESGTTASEDTASSQAASSSEDTVTSLEDGIYYWDLNYNDPAVRKAFEEYYADEIAQQKQRYIQNDLHNFQALSKQLDAANGFLYYITDGEQVYTNLAGAGGGEIVRSQLETQFRQYGAYVICEDNDYQAEPQVLNGQDYQSSRLRYMFEDYYFNGDFKAYMAFDDNYIAARDLVFTNSKNEIVSVAAVSLVCAVAALALLAFLIVTAGKRREDGTVILRGIGRWYTEVIAFLLCMLPALGAAFIAEVSYMGYSYSYSYYYGDGLYSHYSNSYSTLQWAFMAVVCFVGAVAFLSVLLAAVEKLKAKKLLHDSLIFRICRGIGKGVHEIYSAGTIMVKAAIAVVLTCLLSATIVLAPVTAVVMIFLIARYLKQYEEIKKGVKEVKNGNLSYQIPQFARGSGELSALATDINQISQGFDLAVKQELKNQRMKTELISNVSHDIKTPLTSIITYVDLLKQEGVSAEDQEKYLEILSQKSMRLKNLTEDLFEAAKASSGDIPVHFEKVDLLSLVNQGLGEMNDRLLGRGLEVILKTEQEKYYVNADGQLLWRVVENLLGNVIKYAQKNSRVYIDLRQENHLPGSKMMAVLEMKNISENPLNIPADELMERFKRGDEARATEGSGLGLAIAKDLTAMQNGTFDIIVDGDLFKVVVVLESVQEIKAE